MRVALCISGQARTWKRCYQTWLDSVSHLGEVDIFYHLWNYDTLPSQASSITLAELPDIPLSRENLQELYVTLKPKKYLVQPKRFYPKPKVEHQIAWWTRNQFYSMKRAAFLKRSYEIENNFEYDIVCRLRTDLILNYKVPNEKLDPNTAYTCVNHFDTEYNTYRIGDIYFYADSFTYDQMANFYDCFDYVDALDVVPTATIDYPPEVAFYYYLKSLGIFNHQIYVDSKIARTEEYSTLMSGLAKYESL
ncbi:MAG: hypothetical protein ACHQ1D_01790 [Nitrososphaerales archaeon]